MLFARAGRVSRGIGAHGITPCAHPMPLPICCSIYTAAAAAAAAYYVGSFVGLARRGVFNRVAENTRIVNML